MAFDAQAQSELSAPIASRNLSPLYVNLGIPVMASAAALGKGEFRLGWSLSWASHSVREADTDGVFELDGETRRQDLRWRIGLGYGVTLALNLPYITHSGGQLDGLIDDWHATWGLPDGPRRSQPSDALRFSYSGMPGFSLDASVSGLGDAEASLGLALRSGEHWQLGAFAQYKFDTGDVAEFTGSGDDGAAIGARFSHRECLHRTLTCHVQAGVSDVGNSALDADADRYVAFVGFSLAWQLRESLVLLAQLEGHDVVYARQALTANGAPVWGTLGLRWRPDKRWLVDAQFMEDLAVGSAPDVTFRLGFSRSF